MIINLIFVTKIKHNKQELILLTKSINLSKILLSRHMALVEVMERFRMMIKIADLRIPLAKFQYFLKVINTNKLKIILII
jgi:hypothetical protein